MANYIATDKSKLDIDKIYQYISTASYWGKGRTLEEVQTTIANSFCFGLYDAHDNQIGFARLVTDYVLFAYIMDVIVFPEYQGRGFGKEIIAYIMNHDILKKVKTVALKTKDAHSLYERYGFKKVGDSVFWMAIDKIKLECE